MFWVLCLVKFLFDAHIFLLTVMSVMNMMKNAIQCKISMQRCDCVNVISTSVERKWRCCEPTFHGFPFLACRKLGCFSHDFSSAIKLLFSRNLTQMTSFIKFLSVLLFIPIACWYQGNFCVILHETLQEHYSQNNSLFFMWNAVLDSV